MLKLSNLTIKNFLSVGNVTQAMRLDETGLTLILGQNTDSNGGTTRNGAGKSTILQAISYALFGKPLTKIKIPNLINNINGKGMVVTIEFSRDGIDYRIERGKKPDVMEFYIDDIKQKFTDDTGGSEALGENRHTQAEIDRILGMSHTMFKHIVALNTFTDPFLKMGAADQRTIIEELLGITQISQRADVLKKLINGAKESIRDQESMLKATTEANDRINATIRQAEDRASRWDLQHAQLVKELAADLMQTESIDFVAALEAFDALDAFLIKERELNAVLDSSKREMSLLEREAAALVDEAKKLRRDADKGVEDQVTRLQADIKRKTTYMDRHAAQVVAFTHERVTAVSDIENADKSDCVCCGQALQGTDHLATVLVKLQARVVEIDTKIEVEKAEAHTLFTEIKTIEEEIEKLKLDETTRSDALRVKADEKAAASQQIADRVITHAAKVDDALKSITALGAKPAVSFNSRDEVYRVRQARDNLERELTSETEKTNPHSNEIENLKKALQELDYTRINEQTELLKHQDFLLKLLSNKDSFIRKKIIDQNLSYLNSRLNYYLDKLGLPHEVSFQSDLTVDITNLGRDFDFEQLSRGEMNRVIMATSWSFRDMWESTNTGCNLLWVDELLDQGTDTQGVEAALSILKGMARDRGKNVFLISHRDELQARIDRTLMVRKENGFTELEIDGV